MLKIFLISNNHKNEQEVITMCAWIYTYIYSNKGISLICNNDVGLGFNFRRGMLIC